MSNQFKSLSFQEHQDGKWIEVKVTGRLEKDDYETFGPEVNRLVQKYGKLRILFVMKDFKGWSAGGLWEDVKFDVRHFNDVERLALVGERKWEQAMAAFCGPFTTAQIKYFNEEEYEQAKQWVSAAGRER